MRKQPIKDAPLEVARMPARTWDRAELIAAAEAIANARAMRRGVRRRDNALDLLRPFGGGQLYREILEDAEAALIAAERARLESVPTIRGDEWAPVPTNHRSLAASTRDAA